MQYRVSRNDQEFGPYTLEELQRYASEGSILPNDYVFNGVEWVLVSQFLEDPHKGMATSQSISSIANLAPQNNFSNQHINAGDSSGKSKLNLKSIVGAIIVIAIIAYNFFDNQNAEKALRFHNGLVELSRENANKIESFDFQSKNSFKEISSWIKKTLQQVEDVSFYEGKNGMGCELKDAYIGFLSTYNQFLNDSYELLDEFEREGVLINDVKDQKTKKDQATKLLRDFNLSMEGLERSFNKDFEVLGNKFNKIKNQYAKNNNLELID